MAELKKIRDNEKREPTPEEIAKINQMIHNYDNAIPEDGFNETEAIKAQAAINYEILCCTKSITELNQILIDYHRQIFRAKDKEYMKLSRGERKSIAALWLWENHGLTTKYIQKLEMVQKTDTAIWVEKLQLMLTQDDLLKIKSKRL